MSLLLVLCAYALQVFFLPAHVALGDHLLAEECLTSIAAVADHAENHLDESDEHDHQHDHGCELFVQRLQPLLKRASVVHALPSESSWSTPVANIYFALVPSRLLDLPSSRHRFALGSRGPPAAA